MLREDLAMSLSRWGWNSYFEALWGDGDRGNAVPARVIAQQRRFWRVAGDFGEGWAEAAGRLRDAAAGGAASLSANRRERKLKSKSSRRMRMWRCWCPHWTATSIRAVWNAISHNAGSPARGQ